uniref:Uncharacterized protein n=1 Tax=Fagus sylvatica TaxID=28930 RepID=A0A2N9IPZ5_FAGSY
MKTRWSGWIEICRRLSIVIKFGVRIKVVQRPARRLEFLFDEPLFQFKGDLHNLTRKGLSLKTYYPIIFPVTIGAVCGKTDSGRGYRSTVWNGRNGPLRKRARRQQDYPLSTKGDCSPKYGSPADRRSAKYSTPVEGPRGSSARIPESPLSSEKPERKGGSRNSKKNSSS